MPPTLSGVTFNIALNAFRQMIGLVAFLIIKFIYVWAMSCFLGFVEVGNAQTRQTALNIVARPSSSHILIYYCQLRPKRKFILHTS